MEVLDGESGSLAQALLQHGFRAIDEFESFVTFARDDDPVKIHVAPDGAFAAFDDKDELITEGEGAEDFYRALVRNNAARRSPRKSTAAGRASSDARAQSARKSPPSRRRAAMSTKSRATSQATPTPQRTQGA